MLSRRAALAFLAAPLVAPAGAQDRCAARADAALTRVVAQTLPAFAACIYLSSVLAGCLSPVFVRTGRGLSSSALDRWRSKVGVLLSEEHERQVSQWQKLAPKSLKHSSIVDTWGRSAAVSCTDASASEVVLGSAWANEFWPAQRRVLAKTPFWVLAGLTEYLRSADADEPFQRARQQTRSHAPTPVFPLPFLLPGAQDIAALYAVARSHDDERLQHDIRLDDDVLKKEAAAFALSSRQMQVVQRVLLDEWRRAMAQHFPGERTGANHLKWTKAVTGLLEQA